MNNFDCLICPKCSDRLEPLLLDVEVDSEDGHEYQTIWWTCRGLATKTCIFPLNMPKQVFWTKRTMDQMREGLLPLPNIHLLPKHLHHLYPNVFCKDIKKPIAKISAATTTVRPKERAEKLLDVIESNETNNRPSSTFSSDVMSNRVEVNRYRTPVYDDEIESNQVKYCGVDSRRAVELFADSNSALSSNLSLKFSTDTFLSAINSEMSRKQLITPPPAINQRQRIRMLNYIDKYQKVSNTSIPPPSHIIDSLKKDVLPEKIEKNIVKVEKISKRSAHFQPRSINMNVEELSKIDQNNYQTDSSSKAQQQQSLKDNPLRAFFYREENAKKNYKRVLMDNENVDLAMHKFKDSLNTRNLMLRLGLNIDEIQNHSPANAEVSTAVEFDDCSVEINVPFTVTEPVSLLQLQEVQEACFSGGSLSVDPPSLKGHSTISDLASSQMSQVSTSSSSITHVNRISNIQQGPMTPISDCSNDVFKRKRKKKRALKTPTQMSFGDPEIDNLVKRKYKEFINGVSAECKRKRLMNESTQITQIDNPSHSDYDDFFSFDTSANPTIKDDNINDNSMGQQDYQIVDEHGFPMELSDPGFQSIRGALDFTYGPSMMDDHFNVNNYNMYGDDDLLTFGLDQF